MNRNQLASLLLALSLLGCGGSSPSGLPPLGGGNPLTVSTGALTEGVTWKLNRAIDITLDRAVDFGSVSLASVAVLTLPGGVPVNGSYELGGDAMTGAVDARVIRFQPHCAVTASEPGGFQQGAQYILVVRGADSTTTPLRALDGAVLATTIEVRFSTPSSTNPAILYHDSVGGAPNVVVRGRQGAPLDDPNSTRFELGRLQPDRVELRVGAFGALEVDPGSLALVPNGLPLNHYVAARNQVALVVEFDQAVQLSPENLSRLELQHLSGAWRRIPCRVEPLVGCGRRGSTVRVRPLGTLPPGAPLRLVLAAGFADLVGDSRPTNTIEWLPIAGTSVQDSSGARVDALFETFSAGGSHPESTEDFESDLGAPRGFWGSGFIAGAPTPDGVSRVRSKWYPVGLAGVDSNPLPAPQDFSFHGVDTHGVVRSVNGVVVLDPTIIGPVAPAALQLYTVALSRSEITDPLGLRTALPALLLGDRARLGPDPSPNQVIQSQIFDVEPLSALANLHLGYGCYIPGFEPDCAPWNLSGLFPAGTGATLEIRPQSFELYTGIVRDALHPDHRVTLRFDATLRDAAGQPDPAAAFSASNAWASDVAQLSGVAWDFLRFEVQFELDVSGDGYQALERVPLLDFIKIGIDFRR